MLLVDCDFLKASKSLWGNSGVIGSTTLLLGVLGSLKSEKVGVESELDGCVNRAVSSDWSCWLGKFSG